MNIFTALDLNMIVVIVCSGGGSKGISISNSSGSFCG